MDMKDVTKWPTGKKLARAGEQSNEVSVNLNSVTYIEQADPSYVRYYFIGGGVLEVMKKK